MSGGRLSVKKTSGAVSLQDGGRTGFQRYGLSGSGPMDRLAMAAANALVGNPPDAPAVEFGLGGGRFLVEAGCGRFAVAGALCGIRLDGAPLAGHCSFHLAEGADLILDPPREGIFVYLAVAGGFCGTPILGSVSLHQRAGLGGIAGRGFQASDTIDWAGGTDSGDVTLDAVPIGDDDPIRVVLGPQADRFTQDGLATLLNAAFTVSHRADRMGYQLDGPAIAHGPGGYNIVSDATVAGSVQVPGSGRPIVLMADRQTTGGYPKIATVVSADLRRLAQRRPGAIVRFAAVDLDTARDLARRRAAAIADLPARLRRLSGIDAERLMQANLAGQAVDALAAEPPADSD